MFSTLPSLNPPPAPLSTSSKLQSTPEESSQRPPHGAITSMVHHHLCSKSSGLALPWKTQIWYWIPPPVPSPRRGIPSTMPKGPQPSNYSFSPIARFNSPSFLPVVQSPLTMSSTSGKPREPEPNSLYVYAFSPLQSHSLSHSLLLACKQ